MRPEVVRGDFPVFAETDGRPVAYLDNACTTLKPYAVVDAVADYYRTYPVCGERSVHRMAAKVTTAVADGRAAVADLCGVAPEDVVFTKNATEAINLVAAATDWRKGDVVLTSDKEHNSNFVPWLRLAQTRGVEHRVVETRADGTFDLEAFERAVEEAGDALRLASFVSVSNVDGVVFPIQRIAKGVHDAGGRLLVDAAQSAAHSRPGLRGLGADFMALSLHKMLGPSGVGALVATPEAWEDLGPWQLGGGTVARSAPGTYELVDRPGRYEAGLGNYAGLVGVKPGVDYLKGLVFDAIQSNDARLNAHATGLLDAIEGVQVLGPGPEDRTSIVPFIVEGFDAHDVCLYLDEAADVAVRSGAHCVHSYFERRGLAGTVRASFHAYNTQEDVERMAAALERLVAARRKPSPARA